MWVVLLVVRSFDNGPLNVKVNIGNKTYDAVESQAIRNRVVTIALVGQNNEMSQMKEEKKNVKHGNWTSIF